MARATILVTNGVEIKKAPIGYSWTVLFWGFFPPLFRSDWLWAAFLFIGNIITYGIIGFIFSFFYNKIYLKNLFEKGYWIHALDPMITEDGIRAYVGYMKLPEKKDVV